MRSPVSPALLHELLRHDEKTGFLYWRRREARHFKDGKHSAQRCANVWNGSHAGKRAFKVVMKVGYYEGCINYRKYTAHRVVWAMVKGAWPQYEIDHINGNKLDNRIANLRDVPKVVNSKNASLSTRNQSNVIGVSWINRDQRWYASIGVNGKCFSLGTYVNFEDACRARRDGEKRYRFHQNHGRIAPVDGGWKHEREDAA